MRSLKVKSLTLKNFYINILFPVWALSNIITASDIAFAAEGETNKIRLILKLIRYCIYVVSIVIILSKITKKKNKLILSILLISVVFLSLFITRNVQVTCSIFVFLALVDYRWDEILYRQYLCLIIGMFSIVFLSQIGIINDIIRKSATRADRHFLGFNWVTYASVISFFITLSFCVLKKGKIIFPAAILLIVLNTGLFLLTDARFSYCLSILTIIFYQVYYYFSNKHQKILKKVTKLTILSPIYFCLISIPVHAFYDPQNELYRNLNKLLSNRLYYGQKGIVKFGITLLGQKIKWQGWDKTVLSSVDYNFVDCTYLHVLIENGVVFLLVFLFFLVYGIKKAYSNKEYYLCWAIFIICAFGMIEIWLLNFTFNPFIFCGVGLFQSVKNYKIIIPTNRRITIESEQLI